MITDSTGMPHPTREARCFGGYAALRLFWTAMDG
jgi:hypothetical protein